MLELLILKGLLTDYSSHFTYRDYIDKNYDSSKMEERYIELGKKFLNEYALNKTEKSEENL